jgi:hypothetical protein
MNQESSPSAIRPALDTLRELDDGRFLDKLAVQIHDAVSAVTVLGKAARVSIAIDIAPLTKQGLSEPVITMETEITTKLPKPEAPRAERSRYLRPSPSRYPFSLASMRKGTRLKRGFATACAMAPFPSGTS